jgi:hypothetical protein
LVLPQSRSAPATAATTGTTILLELESLAVLDPLIFPSPVLASVLLWVVTNELITLKAVVAPIEFVVA